VVGAIVARTWRLPAEVAVAVRLHHDFTSLNEERFSHTVRHLVAMGLIADHLVHVHEGLPAAKEWEQYSSHCLAHLQVDESEVEMWVDQLHPAFENARVH